MKKQTLFYLSFIFVLILVFYQSVLFQGRVPIPTDTLVNLYHPFRDYLAQDYPRGVPFRNVLVNDPVTQQIPWKSLVVSEYKKGDMPLWNPYAMSGYPLLGNIQSAPLYPLNIFLFLPFISGWSIFIILQQVLAAFFMFLFLRSLKLTDLACTVGAVAFAFCGFVISWLEWGNLIHTALWLPLLFLCANKIVDSKNKILWSLILVFGIAFSYLAGHLQTWIYAMVVLLGYMTIKIPSVSFIRKNIVLALGAVLVMCILLLPVIFVQFQFIFLSARDIDQSWLQPGWFIPWQHLVQFIAPDYFGNPATGNYWSIFNYGEFVGYVGIVPLLFALTAVIYRRDRLTVFFSIVIAIAFIFAFPTFIAKIPYQLGIPFLSSTQPTRLIFIIDIALCVLAALGVDFVQKKRKIHMPPVVIIGIVLVGIFMTTYYLQSQSFISTIDWQVARKNLIIPSSLVFISLLYFFAYRFMPEKIKQHALLLLLLLMSLDLLFFATKYTPFANPNHFYPITQTISFLQKESGNNRIMATDRRIMHPNVPTFYQLQSIDGYDPLYLKRYGELMASTSRNKADISQPFGFLRTITVNNYTSPIIDLLGVKYILSLTDLEDPDLEKVFEEGETKVYENLNVFPRAFFVSQLTYVDSSQEAINFLFDTQNDLRTTAVVEAEEIESIATNDLGIGSATIREYVANRVTLATSNDKQGFLILTDTFYPTWKATVDGKPVTIYRSDFNFRGIVVPSGSRTVEFKNGIF